MVTKTQVESRKISVRVWGMDANGRPFSQDALAEITPHKETSLSGLTHLLKPGDIIGVQQTPKKARFQVLWVIDAGALEKIQAGIRIVDGQQLPWEGAFYEAAVAPPPSSSEHRRWSRHAVFFPIEIRDENPRASLMQTNATDVGGRGCYIESRMPIPVGTRLQMGFWIETEKILTVGLVRTCDPGVGMGIEFVEFNEADQLRLQRHLEKIDPKHPSEMGAGAPSSE